MVEVNLNLNEKQAVLRNATALPGGNVDDGLAVYPPYGGPFSQTRATQAQVTQTTATEAQGQANPSGPIYALRRGKGGRNVSWHQTI
jgi:hypothetical protein